MLARFWRWIEPRLNLARSTSTFDIHVTHCFGPYRGSSGCKACFSASIESLGNVFDHTGPTRQTCMQELLDHTYPAQINRSRRPYRSLQAKRCLTALGQHLAVIFLVCRCDTAEFAIFPNLERLKDAILRPHFVSKIIPLSPVFFQVCILRPLPETSNSFCFYFLPLFMCEMSVNTIPAALRCVDKRKFDEHDAYPRFPRACFVPGISVE